MIAVDAMGGDNAPHAIVQGAYNAAKNGIPILLCGDAATLEALLLTINKQWYKLPITIEHFPDTIAMDEEPSKSVRSKPHSSLVGALQSVASNKAQAFVSAGNSGAVLVASIMHSGRIPGIARPAVGGFLPKVNGRIFCMDLGVNVDCKPEYLYQFALMSNAYLQAIHNIKDPKIGLLSNGHEAYKGSDLVKKTFDRLNYSTLNFIGNVEARGIFDTQADILIADGFSGNIMLKSVQATASTLFSWMKEESQKLSWFKRFLLWMTKDMFSAIKQRTDYASVGGAVLLGVKHPVVLAHGRSDARAIMNAIMLAHKLLTENRIGLFHATIKKLLAQENSISGMVKQKIRTLFGQKKQ